MNLRRFYVKQCKKQSKWKKRQVSQTLKVSYFRNVSSLYSILPKKERKNSTSLPWFLNLNCFRFFQGKLKTPKKPIRYKPTFRRFYKGFDPTVVFCWGCCNKGLSASSYFDDRNSHIFSLSRNKSFRFFLSPFSLQTTFYGGF